MKRLALVLALGTFAFAGVQASTIKTDNEFNLVQIVQDKEEIKAEDLPQAVKDTITESEETQALTISKAYKMLNADGTVTYEVQFGMEEDAVTKKYDAEGNEIIEE
ncbi:hypothetical protein KZP23_05345 [Echinicola marina]|uniref:hypothetical protein n=1 Tax=Echinicola marina TaxID=2859768 RepID=UPI001CF6EF58|nr:hypothetical protein [Echinicola marina]UCS94453.1 hypothetical protein KZP23_05345 [Echinicola marina]